MLNMNPFAILFGFYCTALAIVILVHQGSNLSTTFAIVWGLLGLWLTGMGFSD